MVVRQFDTNMSVLDAAKMRIINAFESNKRIYFAFSCGKDSTVLASLIFNCIMNGDINPKQLTVFFVDEEGIYPLHGQKRRNLEKEI